MVLWMVRLVVNFVETSMMSLSYYCIDTVVDELIGEKPKDLPEVVLRSEYEDILTQLNACLQERRFKETIRCTIKDIRTRS